MGPITETAAVGIIVAHPDDETLWTGGTILLHPRWHCRIYSVCRGSDLERASRFRQVLNSFGASGELADLDDGVEQAPLSEMEIGETVTALAAGDSYDLLITHGPRGEYTSHQRHIEVSRTVLHLWKSGIIRAERLWQFAYEDGGGAYLPRPAPEAEVKIELPEEVRRLKHFIITQIYGFAEDSWESQAAGNVEAFRELLG